ncbi:MAG: hypothetical protein ACTHJR_06440 [Sphingomonas sp.]|uniref:hypothetical protein n=1 Tax=Sphingomonas sp. TaxID=28214 RepID=UPI003F7E4B40
MARKPKTPVSRNAHKIAGNRYKVPSKHLTADGKEITAWRVVEFKPNNMLPPTGNREAARRLRQLEKNNG